MTPDLKPLLKSVLPDDLQRRARRLSRLRWLTKVGILRHYGYDARAHPLRAAAYVLLDPEVESFTYEIANEDELVAFVARVLDAPEEAVRSYLEETRRDPELTSELARRVRWRWDAKRRLPIGNRLAWYAIVRALRPALVVETGIYDGLGSLVLLRALEHNAREGAEGRLLSFDLHEDTGWLVPDRLAGRWEPRRGATTFEALEPAVRGRRVDLLIHDTPHTAEIQRHEFAVALRHGAERTVVIDSSGLQQPVLRDLCARHGVPHHHFREQPRDHFFDASGFGLAILPGGSASP